MHECKRIWLLKDRHYPTKKYIEWAWSMGEMYIQEVLEGVIPVKKEIIRAIERHQRMVDEANNGTSIYQWRPEKIEKVLAFFSTLDNGSGQFKIMPYQVFVLFLMFGMYFSNSEDRVANHLFLNIPAKNGKTTFSAALMLYFFVWDVENFPISITIASEKKQAGISMLEAVNFIENSPYLKDRVDYFGTSPEKYRIIFKKSPRGRIRKPGEARSYAYNARGIQGVNPNAVILDEVHVYKDHDVIQSIENRFGTKKNTMVFMPTTAGITKDGKSVAKDYVNRGIRMLDPDDPVDDPRWIYILYGLDEGDDPRLESSWYKAQPALGYIKDPDIVKAEFEKARVITSNWDDFKMFQLNIFTEHKGTWIPPNILSPLFKPLGREAFFGSSIYGGMDLSDKDDLCAIAWVGEKGGRYFGWVDFFVANNDKAIVREGKDLTTWIEQGFITKSETQTMDMNIIHDYIMGIHSKYKIVNLHYDPNKTKQLIANLERSGLVNLLFPVHQSHYNFEEPINQMQDWFYNDKIDLVDNPCTRWNFNNVIIHKDWNNYKKFEKKSATRDSQDGAVAFGMATYGWIKERVDTTGEQQKKQVEAWMNYYKRDNQ
jgi:phage terminase large subunit-like protein